MNNKDAYYFPHDSNASKDPKILGLRLKCKLEGVAIFWMLIEILRDSPNYKYIYDLPTLELGLSLPQATLQATLQACFELGLLVEKNGFFSSPSLDRRMGEIDRRRDVLRDAGRRGGIKSSQAQARLKPGSSHPQAVKESKVKESKEKKNKDLEAFTPQADFVKRFAETYETRTGEPYRIERKDYVLSASLISSYGLDACIKKAVVLAALCESKSAWFTKDGWASYTIGKLSSQWNSIIPEARQLTREEEVKIEMKRQEEMRERADRLVK